MTNRRQFLESTLAAVAVSGLTLDRAAFAAEAPRLALERFVFDRRFPDAVAAARQAAARGVALAETAGDLTSLWYHDLDLRWKAAPMTLGGMTTRGALFVLETFATDRGMRVLESRVLPDAAAYHAADSEPLYAWTIAPRRALGA